MYANLICFKSKWLGLFYDNCDAEMCEVASMYRITGLASRELCRVEVFKSPYSEGENVATHPKYVIHMVTQSTSSFVCSMNIQPQW